jgi:hypothetical protein
MGEIARFHTKHRLHWPMQVSMCQREELASPKVGSHHAPTWKAKFHALVFRAALPIAIHAGNE